MRLSLHAPLRRPWPVTAAAAGREYRYRRKATLPDWPTPIRTRWRFEISIAGCAPAVISPGLYFTRTDYERWQILRLLHAYGKWFAHTHGLRLPIGTGRFVEAGEVFVFEDEGNPYTFARLRVPRRIVVAGEGRRRPRPENPRAGGASGRRYCGKAVSRLPLGNGASQAAAGSGAAAAAGIARSSSD